MQDRMQYMTQWSKTSYFTILHNLHTKRRYVCLFVCGLPIADRTAGPIKTKLGIGTHVDPGSVLVKVKVNVIWRLLVNANKTPYRGPQGPREFECEA